jgi:hypothetical protein
LHADGRGHGSAGRLIVGSQGRVRLAENGSGGDPKVDVLDLGHAVEVRLGQPVPDLLRRLLATCRCPDPGGRPTADELVALAPRIAAPAPVHLPRAHPRGRALVAGVAAVVALAVAVALGRAWGHDSEHPTALPRSTVSATSPAGAASPSALVPRLVPRPAPTDWKAVLVAKDEARQQVWATGRGAQLAAADAPGSPAEQHDVDLLDELRAGDVVARGWQARIDRVTVVSARSHRVRLRMRDRLAAYTLVADDGSIRHRAPARGPHWWLVELRRVNGAWLTWSIQPTKSA